MIEWLVAIALIGLVLAVASLLVLLFAIVASLR